jgi:hypothetical protein
MTTTHMLETAAAEIAYDVRGPLPTADGRPPLLMIGQPMDASGFETLASHFPDRTVVTCTAVATSELLGQQATAFPSHHGGFLGGEFGYAGQPEAFARKLREVLDQD